MRPSRKDKEDEDIWAFLFKFQSHHEFVVPSLKHSIFIIFIARLLHILFIHFSLCKVRQHNDGAFLFTFDVKIHVPPSRFIAKKRKYQISMLCWLNFLSRLKWLWRKISIIFFYLKWSCLHATKWRKKMWQSRVKVWVFFVFFLKQESFRQNKKFPSYLL